MRKVVILYNELLNNTPDEIDVLAQRDLVRDCLTNLGIAVECLTFGRDMIGDMERVKAANADVVFNLVESGWGKGELIYFAPALLNALKLPYTGVPLDALFVTTNKVLAKKIMRLNQLPTADFYTIDQLDRLQADKQYIVKPIWEEASVGISADSVFSTEEAHKMTKIGQVPTDHYFIEEFIDGREFNVSLLARASGVEVLPPAEMIFSSFFDDKPKVVGYKAKWDDKSEEYNQTNRAFNTLDEQSDLGVRLRQICLKSWDVFNLKGYARIDFRIDAEQNIYILEINGNPCISPDSGFVAAVLQAGYNINSMIKRIVDATT